MNDFKSLIRDIPDYPQEGVLFRDITTLIKDGAAYKQVIDGIIASLKGIKVDYVAGPEARGFITGATLAYALGAGFVPIRKPGKLPCEAYSYEYALEYGTGSLQMHKDAISPGSSVVIADDLLATGGTALAACKLIEVSGAKVAALRFIIELSDLGGREALKGYDVMSEVIY